MKKFFVKTNSSGYHVLTGDLEVSTLSKLITGRVKSDFYFVLIDKKVKKLYGKKLFHGFNLAGVKFKHFEITSSENLKSFASVQKIFYQLTKIRAAKDICLVAVGGGIVGDVGGFAASTYMRGIRYVQVPTTILSAVDSSIGGKTGINFENAKNLIGTFYQPSLVVSTSKFFYSLPQNVIDSGLGEIIKYCYLAGGDFYNYVLNNFSKLRSLEKKVMTEVLEKSIKFKASVVKKDEKETSLRKILNFGHTFAHAYESYFNFKISHGKAVVAGIKTAVILSEILGIIARGERQNYLEVASKIKLPKFLTEFDNDKMIEIMKLDKKSRNQKIKFVLIKKPGEIIIDVEVDNKKLKQALTEFKRTISV